MATPVTPPSGYTLDAPPKGGVTPPSGYKLDSTQPALPPSPNIPTPPDDSVIGGFMRRGIAAAKGVGEIVAPKEASFGERALQAVTGPVLPAYRAAKAYYAGTQQTLEEAEKAASEGKTAKSAVLSVAAGVPLTAVGVPSLYEMAEQGRTREALGAGAFDVLTLKGMRQAGAPEVKAATVVPSESIAGVKLPLTVGQAMAPGIARDLMNTAASYLRKVPAVGRPLQEIAAKQVEGVQQGLANLAKSPASPTEVASNWAKARDVARAEASPIYEQLADAPVPNATKVAADLLADEQVTKLAPAAKDALRRAVEGSGEVMSDVNSIAKRLGYKSYADAVQQVGRDQFMRYVPPDLAQQLVGAEAKFADVQAARSELGDAAYRTKDLADRRVLYRALDKLDESINSDLTPEQAALRQQANHLWERSYVQQRIYDALRRDLAKQPVGEGKLRAPAFTKLVNELNEPGRGIPGNRTRLDVLFDNAADKQSMVKLAQFLQKTQGAGEGLAPALVKLGLVTSALLLPYHLITSPTFALHTAETIGTLGLLSKALASPGGAAAAMDVLRTQGANAERITELTGRLGQVAGVQTKTTTAPPAPGQPAIQAPPAATTTPTGRELTRLGIPAAVPPGAEDIVSMFMRAPRYRDWDDDQRREELTKLLARVGKGKGRRPPPPPATQ